MTQRGWFRGGVTAPEWAITKYQAIDRTPPLERVRHTTNPGDQKSIDALALKVRGCP